MTSVPVRHADTLIFPASLDPKAVSVVRRLNEAGLQSYLVGGCVRDLLLGKIPKDFDVSTEGRPRQIRRLFRNCRVIGRRFKLAHVHFGDQIIEVATFRRNPAEAPVEADAEEEGFEEPEADDLLITRDNVYGTAEEDVRRRDFTINALLYDVESGEVIDYVGGVEDVQQRILRTIGDPLVRLAEDPVRMLRAVKFVSRLDLTLEPGLDAAMRACSDLIAKSAPARVLEEIFRLLTCGSAGRALDLLAEYGLLERLLPELAAHWSSRREQLAAVGRALDRVDGGRRKLSNAFFLAALFHDPWRERLESAGDDPLGVARDLFAPIAQRMFMPRRDVAIAKQLLLTQLRLERPRRSRRFRMNEFLLRPITREAIDLLYVRAQAEGVDPEIHASWAQRLASLEVPREQARPGRGRRRRGRRSGSDAPRLSAPLPSLPPAVEPMASEAAPPAPLGAPPPELEPTGASPDETRARAEGGRSPPRRLGGVLRSLVRRMFRPADRSVSEEPEEKVRRDESPILPVPRAPAAPEEPTPRAAPAAAAPFGPARSTDETHEDGSADAEGRGPGGAPRRRRRRKRRRSRGGGAQPPALERVEPIDAAAEAPSVDGPDGDGTRPAESSAEGRSRRRRGGRKRRGSRAGLERPAASAPRSNSPPRRNRRSQPQGEDRKDPRRSEADAPHRPSPAETDQPPRRNPEDIEDYFDW